mmetsp:Transcript_16770/g.52420  ORF Transcript_16770/g.52420 Transcript_16770/m.52420 type:complete len:100 (+) Transcript_16770:1439-1738(+)
MTSCIWRRDVGLESGLTRSMRCSLPSRIQKTRSANPLMCTSWVTMMMVMPSECNLHTSSRTMAVLYESRSPVGSSMRRIRGWLAMARAIVTRCCSPPES